MGDTLGTIGYSLCCLIGQAIMFGIPALVIYKIIESKRKQRQAMQELVGTIYRAQKYQEEFFDSIKQAKAEPPAPENEVNNV